MYMQHEKVDYGLSLRKRRQWFADDDSTEQDPQPGTPDQDTDDGTSAETENPGADDREPMIPRERFDTVNQRAKDAEKKLAELEAEREKERKAANIAAEKQLAEQGKFKELYESEQQKVIAAETKTADLEATLKTTQDALDALTAVFQEQVSKRMESVPEYVRDLLKDKPPLDVADWLDAHANDLTEPRRGAPSFGARAGLRSPKQPAAIEGPLVKL